MAFLKAKYLEYKNQVCARKPTSLNDNLTINLTILPSQKSSWDSARRLVMANFMQQLLMGVNLFRFIYTFPHLYILFIFLCD